MSREPETESVRSVHGALVDFHNNLVAARFTDAGLYVTGFAALATGVFTAPHFAHWLAGLGLVLLLVVLILEGRTAHLLLNVTAQGLDLEGAHGLHLDTRGFFTLMKSQPVPLKLPILKKLPIPKWLITHTTALTLLFVSTGVFWLVILSPFSPTCTAEPPAASPTTSPSSTIPQLRQAP
jgi:hypothetical protein